MRVLSILLFPLTLAFLVGCQVSEIRNGPARIAVFGDSMMAWNRTAGKSVPQYMARALNKSVTSYAVSGAKITHFGPISGAMGLDIRKQFRGRKGPWDLVVVNGAGNDVYFKCLCLQCGTVVNNLISADGQRGHLPNLLREIEKTGARVVYSGYHRTGGLGGPYDRCADELDIVDARMSKFVATQPRIHFAPMSSAFPPKDDRFYDIDNIHPSYHGSKVLGESLARFIKTLPGYN